MKKAFSLLIAAILSFTAFSQTWVRLEEAQKYAGNTVNLLGFVSDVRYVKNAAGYTTLIKLNGKDRIHNLTLIMRSVEQPDVAALQTAYLNQYVQAKGKVEIHGGKAQIKLFSEHQMSTARQTDDQDRYEPF